MHQYMRPHGKQKGESFEIKETICKVQTEFIEEALRTNQKEAKKKIILKYGLKRQ